MYIVNAMAHHYCAILVLYLFAHNTAMLDPSVAAPGTRPVEGVAPTWTDTQLQPLLGVTPLGPVQLSQEKVYQLKMLESACKHLPQASDSEKVR